MGLAWNAYKIQESAAFRGVKSGEVIGTDRRGRKRLYQSHIESSFTTPIYYST